MMLKKIVPAVVLLLAASAFAADNASKGSLQVSETLTVSGHQLAPGEYQVRWDGTNPNVELRILSQGKLVATVPAHVITLSQAGWANAVESSASADGTRLLSRIDFAGKKYALAVGDESAAGESTPKDGAR
jgi:hypothetical protein